MNRCIFTGNLTKDPELTIIESTGKPKCRFTLAVNRRKKNDDGTRDADFINMTAFEQTAELIAKYAHKGDRLGTECHVKTGSYKKKQQSGEETTVYTTDIIVDNIEFLGSAKRTEGQQEAQPAPAPEAPQPIDQQSGFTVVSDDGLPF